jgi:hypothetical protein
MLVADSALQGFDFSRRSKKILETPLQLYMGADANAKNTHNSLDNAFIL